MYFDGEQLYCQHTMKKFTQQKLDIIFISAVRAKTKFAKNP